MNPLLTILLLSSILACTSQTKPPIKVENDRQLEEKYADYSFKVYSHKDSIEVVES